MKTEKLKKIKSYILNLLYPKHVKCIFCESELPRECKFDTCDNCMRTLPFITKFCLRCGTNLEEDETGVCSQCKTLNHNFNYARSVFVYKDLVQKLVRTMKFYSKKYMIDIMAKYMAEIYATMNIKVDMMTYVPMTKKQVRTRGFNQSKLIAESLEKLINVPCETILDKVIETRTQSSLDYHERTKNLKDCFVINKNFLRKLKDKSILLIDDIVTTGSTADEISGVLKAHGVKNIYVLSFAHTSFKNEKNEVKAQNNK